MNKDADIIQKMPHTGAILDKFLSTHKITKSWVARQLNVSHTSVSQYTESASLSSIILWKLSLILNHNFLSELGAQLPVAYKSVRELELENTISDLQKQLEKTQLELSVYQKIVGK